MELGVRKTPIKLPKSVGDALHLVGMVPLIVGVDHPPGAHIQGGDLCGGRTYVNTNMENVSFFAHDSLEFFRSFRPGRRAAQTAIGPRQGLALILIL